MSTTISWRDGIAHSLRASCRFVHAFLLRTCGCTVAQAIASWHPIHCCVVRIGRRQNPVAMKPPDPNLLSGGLASRSQHAWPTFFCCFCLLNENCNSFCHGGRHTSRELVCEHRGRGRERSGDSRLEIAAHAPLIRFSDQIGHRLLHALQGALKLAIDHLVLYRNQRLEDPRKTYVYGTGHVQVHDQQRQIVPVSSVCSRIPPLPILRSLHRICGNQLNAPYLEQ